MVGPLKQEQPTVAQTYEFDRALPDEHGSSYIETICAIAGAMRSEGRDADADDAMRQCERMCAILMTDADLLAEYQQAGVQMADANLAEVKRRGLLADVNTRLGSRG